MKIKKAEIVSEGYSHSMFNIQIGIDDTDHICFFCPKCKNPLEVIEVLSKRIVIDFEENKDNCTWIYLVCHNCKLLGKRKFYWKIEDGRFCWQKTFEDRKDGK